MPRVRVEPVASDATIDVTAMTGCRWTDDAAVTSEFTLPESLPRRHEACLHDLLTALSEVGGVAVVVLVGSHAGGHGDALSDIDLLIFAADESFDPVWSRRHQVHGPGAVVCWDTIDPVRPGVGAHRWVGADGVLVETLIATVTSGVRVASPAIPILVPSTCSITCRSDRLIDANSPPAHRIR